MGTHKNLSFSTIALCCFITAPAHGSIPAPTQEIKQAEEKILATINGQAVKEGDLMTFFRIQGPQSGLNLNDPKAQTRMMELYIDREVLYQEAIVQKVDQRPEVIKAIEEHRRQEIAKALVELQGINNPITELQIKDFYDKEVANQASTTEYKLSHIQVADEAAGQAVIARLDKGEDFASMASELSLDSTSAENGGDLSWLSPQGMPASFSSVVPELTENQYSKVPVKSDFGWHIVKVNELRQITPPALEDVRPQIQSLLNQRFMSDYMNQVKSKAKIELKQ